MASLAPALAPRSRQMVRPALLIGLAAAALAALIQSLFLAVDCDVSWLITVNEKMLAGQRLYVDVIEANPPASVWLYTPAVWLAHALHVRPEAIIVAEFIAAALLSCAAAVGSSRLLRAPPNAAILCAVVAFVALILPMGNFAQREHAAVLLMIPALAALAVIAENRPFSTQSRIGTGIALGLVVAVKPHFALAVFPAMAFAAWGSRSLKPLLPVVAAAAVIIATYAAAVVVLTPGYLRLLPVLAEVYVAQRERWSMLLMGPVTIVPLTIFALAFMLRPRRYDALATMFLIASGGFALAALVQGRGYLNHALPATALGLAGIVLLGLRGDPPKSRRNFALIVAGGLAALELYAGALIRPDADLTRLVARSAPPHPSLITLGPDLLTGHPLVRNLDGAWAGSAPALFIAAGAHARLSQDQRPGSRLTSWYRADLDRFANDVARERPDAILVDRRPELSWLRVDPAVARTISQYQPVGRAGDTEVWVRRR